MSAYVVAPRRHSIRFVDWWFLVVRDELPVALFRDEVDARRYASEEPEPAPEVEPT